MKYSISRNGQVLGSYTEEEVRGYIQAGRIVATDYALPEGGTQWVLVSQLQFSAASASAPTGAMPMPAVSTATPVNRPAKPGNSMVGAILVTLFCCLALGIPAIVFAAQVDTKYQAGDYAGAQEAAKKAALFSWIGLGVGVLFWGALLVFFAIGAAASV